MDESETIDAIIKNLLIENDAFFNHIYVINQDFDIIPSEKHYGMAINYVDIQESREQFVRELINTVIDWVYSHAKQQYILSELYDESRTAANAFTELQQKAFDKFRPSDDGDLIHGQFGELLLANCLQRFFRAVPILRKMSITTSVKHERFGSDAIHYKTENDKDIFYIGEAKSYTSPYKFNTAFAESIESILKEYHDIQKELRLYMYEEFIDKELIKITKDLINGKLPNAEFRLVTIIAYDETIQKNGSTREEILQSINTIISKRFSDFDKNKIDIAKYPILNRITYVVFPVWEFEKLIKDFSQNIPNQKSKDKS
jgi:hypothetical protein